MDYTRAISSVKKRRERDLENARLLYEEAVNSSPELYAVIVELNSLSIDAAKGEKVSAEKIAELKEKRSKLLEKAGLTKDKLSPPPLCKKCKDTATVNGKVCSCAVSLALANDKDGIQLPLHSFSDLDKDFIADEKAGKTAMLLQKFAEKFPDTKKRNIILMGGAGTGKTFLAGCVAKSVLQSGESVAALTAFGFLNRMLKYHTTFDDTKLTYLDPILDCSLLIIDDLGTESILKNITLEYLYLVLNERMVSGKHTLFTTNLTMSQLATRYGERIVSRMFDKQLVYVGVMDGVKDMRIL